MGILTQDKIQEIIESYKIIGTYSGVSRKCGVSPSTVKKYILLNTPKKPVEKIERTIFNEEIPPAESVKIDLSNWLKLTKEEKQELEILKREL